MSNVHAATLAGGSGSKMRKVLDVSEIQGLELLAKKVFFRGSSCACEDCLLGITK